MSEKEITEWSEEGKQQCHCFVEETDRYIMTGNRVNGSVLKPKCNDGESKWNKNWLSY
jgi:hypothetical protein